MQQMTAALMFIHLISNGTTSSKLTYFQFLDN